MVISSRAGLNVNYKLLAKIQSAPQLVRSREEASCENPLEWLFSGIPSFSCTALKVGLQNIY
jgi:hypothetical protein